MADEMTLKQMRASLHHFVYNASITVEETLGAYVRKTCPVVHTPACLHAMLMQAGFKACRECDDLTCVADPGSLRYDGPRARSASRMPVCSCTDTLRASS